uniref:armadillo repeat-containing protein 7 n=1 Tax=Vespula vulgaris TaxID=7454 RepID=UPI002141BC33|nr:armadillo repeat-containing protein 7 [Vespula vulgaris]
MQKENKQIRIQPNLIKEKYLEYLMFSTKEKLIRRTGQSGIGRYDFLKLLINEFKTTSSKDAKEQVLANLVNFSYDPINYEYLRQLKVIDLFLHILSEDNSTFVRFAIGGICNLCLDPINKAYILRNQGISLVSSLLNSHDEGTILSSITTLMFLITPEFINDIVSPMVIKHMHDLSNSTNNRIKNLAIIFLSDYCQERNKKIDDKNDICSSDKSAK